MQSEIHEKKKKKEDERFKLSHPQLKDLTGPFRIRGTPHRIAVWHGGKADLGNSLGRTASVDAPSDVQSK